MTQHTLINTVAEEILCAVDEWFQQIEQKEGKAIDEIVGRTSLQIGIHDFLHIEYKDEKIEQLYSWINSSPDCQHKGTRLENPLAHQEIENALMPLLEKGIRQKLQTYEDSALVNYRFQASIKVDGSETLPILNDVNQRKRELLLQRIMPVSRINWKASLTRLIRWRASFSLSIWSIRSCFRIWILPLFCAYMSW
jgi:hypothetical protein